MQRLPTYNENDRGYFEFLQNDKGIKDRDDVQLLLSGSGLSYYFEYFSTKVNQAGSSKLPSDAKPEEIHKEALLEH